jgi:hypothetical protein
MLSSASGCNWLSDKIKMPTHAFPIRFSRVTTLRGFIGKCVLA